MRWSDLDDRQKLLLQDANPPWEQLTHKQGLLLAALHVLAISQPVETLHAKDFHTLNGYSHALSKLAQTTGHYVRRGQFVRQRLIMGVPHGKTRKVKARKGIGQLAS